MMPKTPTFQAKKVKAFIFNSEIFIFEFKPWCKLLIKIQLKTNSSEKTSGLSGGLEVNLYRSSKAVANEGEAFFIIILHRAVRDP